MTWETPFLISTDAVASPMAGGSRPLLRSRGCFVLALALAWLVVIGEGFARTGEESWSRRLSTAVGAGLSPSDPGRETVGLDVPVAASPWTHTLGGDVRLVSAVAGVGEGTTVRLGLHFALSPHWKIYWRSPGDAGYPPTIDWTGSQNLTEAAITWPAPRRFSLRGIETAGYEGEVVLPITVTLERSGASLWIRAGVDFLVCAEICVPQQANLTLLIPDEPAEPSPFMHLIERHAARVPGDGRTAGLRLLTAATGPDEDGQGGIIAVAVEADPLLTRPDLFVEGLGDLNAGAPQVRQNGNGQQVMLRVPTRTPVPAGTPVTLTLVDGARAMQATVSLAAGDGMPDTATTGAMTTFVVMLGFAFLGGVILNLMPCVLPVLSLKVMTMINHGGTPERGTVRRSFVASSAGVLFSFLLLAGAAITVKAAGAAVGWGIQFQQPLFLVVMIIVLTLFAANLWGLFEVPLPPWLADLGRGKQERGQIGAFLSGAFATLLATPCSAPFLGTAVGFALARGPLEILLIFTTLGLGMACPYLLIAAFPGLATRLPRPGRWMMRLKGLMGLALATTTIWLLTVLTAQVGERTAILTGLAMATGVGMLALRQRLSLRLRPIATLAALGLMGAAIVVPPSPDGQEMVRPQGPWLPFDEDVLARHVAKGQVVFVDVTADWCVTCQVNKAVVLSRGEVAERLGRMITMQADWTRPDARIAAYLARFGRYGIPFNVVHGPGIPRGLVLPELLTAETVLKALDMAGRTAARRAEAGQSMSGD